MEETNYHRQALAGNSSKHDNGSNLLNQNPDIRNGLGEKAETEDKIEISATKVEKGRPNIIKKGKTFLDKMKLFNPQELQHPNRLKEMILRPIIFLSFPVIAFAGFSYGSNLVWFNVLNGTTSLILSAEPYAFGSSIIGLSYIAPLIGMAIG